MVVAAQFLGHSPWAKAQDYTGSRGWRLVALDVEWEEGKAEKRRFVDIGHSVANRILVVSYTDRGSNIRLISSRRATAAERKVYEEGVG